MSIATRIKALVGSLFGGQQFAGVAHLRMRAEQEPSYDRTYTAEEALRNFIGAMYAASRGNAQLIAGSKWHLSVPATGAAMVTSRWQAKTPSYRERRVADRRRVKGMEFGDDFVNIDDPEHPVIALMNRPNEHLTWTDFLFTAALHIQLADTAFILVEPRRGQPRRLSLLDPSRVRIEPTRDGTEIARYIYHPRVTAARQQSFDPDEIVRLRIPSPDTPFIGYCPARAAWDAIRLQINKHIGDRALQRNLARPDFIALLKGATRDQIDRFASEMESRFRGATNTGNFAVANAEAVDIKPLGQWEEHEFGTPEGVLREIASAFQYPLQRLIGNDPIKANSEVADEAWRRDVSAWLTHFEDAFGQIVDRFDLPRGAVLWVETLTRGDEREEREQVLQTFGTGLMTRDEARVRLGLPEMPDDDQAAAVPTGIQIQSAMQIVAEVAAGAIPRESGVALLESMFLLPRDTAESLIGPAGTPAFVPPSDNGAPPSPDNGDAPPPPPPPPPQEDQQQRAAVDRTRQLVQPTPEQTCVMRELSRIVDEEGVDFSNDDEVVDALSRAMVICRNGNGRSQCTHHLERKDMHASERAKHAIRGVPRSHVLAKGRDGLSRFTKLFGEVLGVPDWAVRMPPVHFDGRGDPNCRCFIDNNGIWNVIVDERTCPWCPILSRAWNTAIAAMASAVAVVTATEEENDEENDEE